ncbi:hypothetical protein K474DRAFT_1678666 [Panus rudis PR-1116 ss-1]|nr:hypothetical protein K474DRAFT_1678666 [Panus rudis PR-1116 ss-1]
MTILGRNTNVNEPCAKPLAVNGPQMRWRALCQNLPRLPATTFQPQHKEDEDDEDGVHAAHFLDDEEEDARLLAELTRRKCKEQEIQALPKLIEVEAESRAKGSEPASKTSNSDSLVKGKRIAGNGFLLARKRNQITTVIAKSEQPAAPSGPGSATTTTVKGKQTEPNGELNASGSGLWLGTASAAAAGGTSQALVPKTEVKTKWTTMHIPEAMRAQFSGKMVPRARILAGTNAPWGPFLTEHTQSIYDKTYPHLPYKVTNQDVFHCVLNYRVSDWQNKIAFHTVAGFKRMLADNTAAEGHEPDEEHPIPSDGEARKEAIKETVAFLLGDGKKEVPYHWAVWGDKKKGTFQGELILYTFANAHLAVFKALGMQDPFVRELADPPIGAIILSIQAVERALSFYKTGEKVIPSGSAAFFSIDNWGDYKTVVDGKPKNIPHASKYMKTLKGWKKEKWDEYIAAAWEHYEEPSRKRGTVIVIDDDEEEEDGDEEFELVSDEE